MIPILTPFILAFILTVIINLGVTIISYSPTTNNETASPFECGFDPSTNSRLPFSLQFFLLAVIFLIFDIEIALIISLPIILNSTPLNNLLLPATLFLLLLIIGLAHEWNEGALSWNSYN